MMIHASDRDELATMDRYGRETLDAMAVAGRFNQWMFDTVRHYCKGKILEVGSGTGTISRFFIDAGYDLTLSDVRQDYLSLLAGKFGTAANCRAIREMDLGCADFAGSYPDLTGQFDTVVALNVVEHIRDDATALKNCALALRNSGSAIVLVPAYQWMYNRFDQELGHYRRYTKTSLKQLFEPYFITQHSSYFNAAGMLGWFVSARILRNRSIPGEQVYFYNRLIPAVKWVDRLLLGSVGLSVIQIGKLKDRL